MLVVVVVVVVVVVDSEIGQDRAFWMEREDLPAVFFFNVLNGAASFDTTDCKA